jgi:peptide/nickel transport system permease protein
MATTVGKYLIRRLLIAFPTLLLISAVIFAILALAPGDPLAQFALNPAIPHEVRERIRDQMGLNEPVPVRYVKWLTSAAQGNLGYSFQSRVPVMDLIWQRLPNTLAVLGVAYVISVLLAIPIGVLSAVKRYSVWDHAATTFAFIGFSIPTFVTGVIFILIFSVKLRWLPFIYDSTIDVSLFDFDSIVKQLRQSIMPITVLALFQTATLARFVRSEMLENLPQDYVRTARAKGIGEQLVVMRHVLRNSLIPVVTLIALGIPTVFAGALITEQIFRIPGIGSLLISGIQNSDTPVVMGTTFIFSVLVVAFNIVADVLYGVLDPRIRYD